MKKILFFTLFTFFICTYCFCQETDVTDVLENQNNTSEQNSLINEEKNFVDENNMSVTEVEQLLQNESFLNQMDFIFGITPIVSVNSHSQSGDGTFVSAPTPFYIPFFIGLSVPNYTAISFQPTLKIFTSYNLVYDNMVLPAEIENRTGLTYSFLLNLPVVFKLNYKNKCSWSLSSGIAGLFRFAVLPDGVQTDESGYTGTVESDIKFMNSWFYENLRFLYLSAGFDWMFYYGKTKYGPEISIYFPISTFTDKSADGMMVSVGVKVEF